MGSNKLPSKFVNFFLLTLLIFVSAGLEAQIYFDIDNRGANGIRITASGSAVIPAKADQYYNLGVLDFGCNYPDESFQDFCQNGYQTTINGGSWSFAEQWVDTSGSSGPGILFNGLILDLFASGPSSFGFSNSGELVAIPDTDGSTPVMASGSLTFPNVDFSLFPGAPGFGQTTIISLFNEGNIIFRLNGSGVTCNGAFLSGNVVSNDATYETCENLEIQNIVVENGATLNLSSGLDIGISGEFLIENGAGLEAEVCGQSLCETSLTPMKYGCHSCVDTICDIDSSCCETAFTQACLEKVRTDCGLVCN